MPKTPPVETWNARSFFAAIFGRAKLIVRVTSEKVAFNSILPHCINDAQCGVLSLRDIDLSNPRTSKLLEMWATHLGWPATASILEGYYLFIDGTAIAYHPGTLEKKDFDKILAGGVSHLLALITEGTLSNIFSSASAATIDWGPAQRLLQFFTRAAEEYRTQKQAKSSGADGFRWEGAKGQGEVVQDETQKAYALLDVSENATPEEIKAAFRSKIMEYHPDRGPSSDWARRNEMMTSLNIARDLLLHNHARK